mgnify:CR=1 FL=1
MPDNIYNKIVKGVAEAASGPVFQGLKHLYNFLGPHERPSTSTSRSTPTPTPRPKAPTEKIYNISKPLKEHEVVSEKTVKKFQNNKSLMDNYNPADKDNSLEHLENKH